jgi:hypothetical protein
LDLRAFPTAAENKTEQNHHQSIPAHKSVSKGIRNLFDVGTHNDLGRYSGHIRTEWAADNWWPDPEFASFATRWAKPLVGVDNQGRFSHLHVSDELLQNLGGLRDDGNIQPLPSLTVEKVVSGRRGRGHGSALSSAASPL